MPAEIWSIALVLTATTLGSFGPIFLKKASHELTFNIKIILTNFNLIMGVLFYGIGTVLFIPALKGGDLALLYPLVSLSYIWVSIWSVKILGEKINTLKWLGMGLIIIGVSLIGLSA